MSADYICDGMLGRADLLRVMVEGGSEQERAVARMLELENAQVFVGKPTVLEVSGAPARLSPVVSQRGSEARTSEERPLLPVTVPYVDYRSEREDRYKKSVRSKAEPLSLRQVHGRPTEKPKLPRQLLATWAELGPKLLVALSALGWGKALDVPRLVEIAARGEALRQLPRQPRMLWPLRLTLVLDRSSRLLPFFSDQYEVRERLGAQLGAHAIQVTTVRSGPCGEIVTSRRRGKEALAARCGETVLLLGDLGVYGTESDRRSWLRLAKRLRRQGNRLAALCPVPSTHRRAPLDMAWNVVPWEADAAADPSAVGLLLRRLAFTGRVEPGLLRWLRRRLEVPANAATEVGVWQHPDVQGGHSAGWYYQPEQRNPWREALQTSLGAIEPGALVMPEAKGCSSADELAKLREVVASVRSWHQRTLPEEIWHEEVLTLAGLLRAPGIGAVVGEEQLGISVDVRAACDFFARLASTLQDDALAPWRSGPVQWVRRVSERLPEQTWQHAQAKEPLELAYWQAHAGLPQAAVPRGMDPPAYGGGKQVHSYRVVLVSGGGVGIERGEEDVGNPRCVAVLHAAEPQLNVEFGTVGAGASFSLIKVEEGDELRVTQTIQEMVLHTDCTELRLGVMQRPEWAVAFGRDEQGLWAERDLGGLRLRTRWMHSHPNSGEWVDDSFRRIPRWVHNHGRDEYGLYITFKVDEVEVKLRYIPPGTFLMGSPDDDADAYPDEKPQRVEKISRGFFLAETPCTQALWEAVAGYNPSRFSGPENPVENVSWEDAKSFLARLNDQIPGLAARLPTEAEWEYSCRSGTNTARYALDVDAIAWFSSGDSEVGTKPVGQKKANRWGLYDMLGNVDEWCSDYTSNAVQSSAEVDPFGAPEGQQRVFRGGSWGNLVRDIRAAYRDGNKPSYRHVTLGFRIARGYQGEGSITADLVCSRLMLGGGSLTLSEEIGLPSASVEKVKEANSDE